MRLRILFPFVGDTVGGSHISTVILIKALILAGHDVKVVLHQHEGPLRDYLVYRRIPHEYLRIPHGLGRMPRTVTGFGRITKSLLEASGYLKQIKPDIIHTNDGRCHLLWTLAGRLNGTPTVWHQRTLLDGSAFTRSVIRLATSTISISHFVKDSLPKSVSRKSIVLPNPVDTNGPTVEIPSPRRIRLCAELELGVDAIVVGIFGNLRTVKAPLVAVDAFLLIQEFLDTEALMLVVGEDREGFSEAMTAKVNSSRGAAKIFFAGFQSQVADWMTACDLILATSRADAFGRTLIEAMSLGVPVVATDAGGHAEILTHRQTGMLASVDHPKEIAAAGVEVVTDPELRRMLISEAKKRVREKYSAAYHAKQMVQLYKSVCM